MDVDGGCRKMCFLFFFFSPLSSSESMYLLSETCLNVSFTYYCEISQTKIIFADIFRYTLSFWEKIYVYSQHPNCVSNVRFSIPDYGLGKAQ